MLQIKATDTRTNQEKILSEKELLDFDSFEIDYLDTVFDYDDFDSDDVELAKVDGFPDYIADTNEDIESAVNAYISLNNDTLWKTSLDLATSANDLSEIAETASALNDDDKMELYLEYANYLNYVPSVSQFEENYQGEFKSKEDFAYNLIHQGVISADEIVQEHGTIEEWAAGDLRFDYEFIELGNSVHVFIVH